MPNYNSQDNDEKTKHNLQERQKYWEVCSCINPPPLKPPSADDSLTSQLIVNQDKLWDKYEILVFFMNGDRQIQDKIFSIAQEWEKYANIKFVRAKNRLKSDIRIDISIDKRSWSLIGTAAKNPLYRNEATMHYGWFYTAKDPDDQEYRATVLHEFGHALGFEHELQHPFDIVPWDKVKVYAWYEQTQNCDKHEVDTQILNLIPKGGNYLMDAKIDVNSIMCYEIDSNLLLNNTDIRFSNQRNWNLSPYDMLRAYTAYPFDFPAIGTIVQVKDKQSVLQSFNIAGRNDYIKEQRDYYNNKQGTVIAHHPTNGVCVCFSDNKKLWYEPLSLTLVSNPDTKPDVKPIRWFVGDRVLWSKSHMQHRIGTIRYHLSNDDNVTIRIGNQCINNVDPKDLIRRVFFYGLYYNVVNPSLSSEPFPVGKSVKILEDKTKLLKAFDMAGRNDYNDEMDDYCNKIGKVIMQHKTNGLKINFDDGKSFWYEPPCLSYEGIFPNTEKDNNRILVDSRVKIIKSDDKFYGHVGHVCLSQDADDDDSIRLSIGDEIFLSYDSKHLKFANHFFLD